MEETQTDGEKLAISESRAELLRKLDEEKAELDRKFAEMSAQLEEQDQKIEADRTRRKEVKDKIISAEVTAAASRALVPMATSVSPINATSPTASISRVIAPAGAAVTAVVSTVSPTSPGPVQNRGLAPAGPSRGYAGASVPMLNEQSAGIWKGVKDFHTRRAKDVARMVGGAKARYELSPEFRAMSSAYPLPPQAAFNQSPYPMYTAPKQLPQEVFRQRLLSANPGMLQPGVIGPQPALPADLRQRALGTSAGILETTGSGSMTVSRRATEVKRLLTSEEEFRRSSASVATVSTPTTISSTPTTSMTMPAPSTTVRRTASVITPSSPTNYKSVIASTPTVTGTSKLQAVSTGVSIAPTLGGGSSHVRVMRA